MWCWNNTDALVLRPFTLSTWKVSQFYNCSCRGAATNPTLFRLLLPNGSSFFFFLTFLFCKAVFTFNIPVLKSRGVNVVPDSLFCNLYIPLLILNFIFNHCCAKRRRRYHLCLLHSRRIVSLPVQNFTVRVEGKGGGIIHMHPRLCCVLAVNCTYSIRAGRNRTLEAGDCFAAAHVRTLRANF